VTVETLTGVGTPGRAAQFTVIPTQHRLYFFPEPHGRACFRPTL